MSNKGVCDYVNNNQSQRSKNIVRWRELRHTKKLNQLLESHQLGMAKPYSVTYTRSKNRRWVDGFKVLERLVGYPFEVIQYVSNKLSDIFNQRRSSRVLDLFYNTYANVDFEKNTGFSMGGYDKGRIINIPRHRAFYYFEDGILKHTKNKSIRLHNITRVIIDNVEYQYSLDEHVWKRKEYDIGKWEQQYVSAFDDMLNDIVHDMRMWVLKADKRVIKKQKHAPLTKYVRHNEQWYYCNKSEVRKIEQFTSDETSKIQPSDTILQIKRLIGDRHHEIFIDSTLTNQTIQKINIKFSVDIPNNNWMVNLTTSLRKKLDPKTYPTIVTTQSRAWNGSIHKNIVITWVKTIL